MVRRCTMAEDEQGGMPHELSAVIQNMVRSRISQNWPRVRAHECRTQRASLQPGEWILAAGATAAQNKWVGLVKRVGVLPFHARQRDYLLPLSALPVLVHWYTEVQGTGRSLRQAVRRRRCDRRFGLACCSPSSGLQHDLRALSTSRLAVCAAQARWQAEVRERIRDAAKDHLPACRAYVREPMVMLQGTVG